MLLAAPVVPAAEPQRALGARGDGAERVAAAAQRRELRVEPPVRLARVEREVGRDRLPHADPAGPVRGGLDRQRRGDAAGEDRRHAPLEPRPRADGQRVGERRAGQRERGDQRRRAGPTTTVASAIDREQRGGARGGAHLGTGTSPSAVRTASSGP